MAVYVTCIKLSLEAKIDGKLLWLMVEDFNEFSIIVTNPVERLHLKQFVKVNSITNLKETAQSENSVSKIAKLNNF